MINCILIQNSEINEVKVKNLSEDIIYKKCNFKIIDTIDSKNMYKMKLISKHIIN